MITPITNHIDQGLARLISRYKNKPRFAAWCASHLRQAQLFEDACWALIAALDVDTADLPRLTMLGKIVGQPARGTLDQFRSYVKVRVLVNRSKATAPNMIKIARILVGDVTFTRWGNAAMRIEAEDGTLSFDPDYVSFLLRLAKGAGVSLDFVFNSYSESDSFSFAAGTAPIADGRGFATAAGTTGGHLARIR